MVTSLDLALNPRNALAHHTPIYFGEVSISIIKTIKQAKRQGYVLQYNAQSRLPVATPGDKNTVCA